MAKTKKQDTEDVDPFEGFMNITDKIVPGVGTEKNINIDKDDIEDIFEDEEDKEEIIPAKDIKKDKTSKKKEDVSEDDEEEIIPVKSKKHSFDENEDDDDVEVDSTDFDEAETVAPFIDGLAEKLGFDLSDDEKPKTFDDVVGYMEEIIEANSKPKYTSELSARFDKYLANGGDPSKFMDTNFGVIDYEKIDIKKEDNQKRILRDYYKEKGFSETKIDKHLERLSDTEDLEEEAKDAQTELIASQKEHKIRLEKEQEQTRLKEVDEHRKFISATESHLEKLDSINGIKITKKEKDEILPYIFQIGRDGKTQQQKDYENNPIEYLVATAYFYKHRDDLKKKLENGNITSAAEKFKQKQKEIKAKQKTNKSDFPTEEVDEGEDWLANIVGRTIKSKNNLI